MAMRYCERCNVRCLTTLCGQCEEQDRIDKASSEAVASSLAADRARIAQAMRTMIMDARRDEEPISLHLAAALLRVVEGGQP